MYMCIITRQIAFWICKCVAFSKFGKFLAVIFSSMFPTSVSLSYPEIPVTLISKLFVLSHRLFRLSLLFCSREGNGTPLQYSCLENPMDGGAWWAAIYGVTQSRTQLKRLSSSSCSSSTVLFNFFLFFRWIVFTSSLLTFSFISVLLLIPSHAFCACYCIFQF